MAEKGTSTLAMRTCRQCGISFMGGPRAWYCPDCRYERQKESTRLSRRRKRLGLTRDLGSTDYCVVCAKPYVVESSNQKYCAKCAPEAIRAIDRQQSLEWSREKLKDKDYVVARNEKRRAKVMKKTCPICGKPTNGENYCCESCADAGRRYLATRNTKRCKGEPLPNFDDYRIGGKNYKKVQNETLKIAHK